MNKVHMLLLILSALPAMAADQNELRILYKKASAEEASCRRLIHILQGYDETNSPLLSGYKACATMMMANHIFNPFEKLSSFQEGKRLLERSVNADITNVELRFLRFSVQTNAPVFLGYNHSIQQDKIFLVHSLPKIDDVQLRELIVSFMIDSDHVSAMEKQKLKVMHTAHIEIYHGKHLH